MRRLTEEQIIAIANALRIAASVYEQDARDCPGLRKHFGRQAQKARELEVMIVEAGDQ